MTKEEALEKVKKALNCHTIHPHWEVMFDNYSQGRTILGGYDIDFWIKSLRAVADGLKAPEYPEGIETELEREYFDDPSRIGRLRGNLDKFVLGHLCNDEPYRKDPVIQHILACAKAIQAKERCDD